MSANPGLGLLIAVIAVIVVNYLMTIFRLYK